MKIAVVGSGCTGLGATWLLNEHSKHEVHIYESDNRAGGHANTFTFSAPGKEPVDVDGGFVVFNPDSYPNFLRFLRRYPHLKILTTSMAFAISRDLGKFEWSGHNLSTIFCQRWRILDPKMWRLIYDVLRFNACARRLIMGWNRLTSPLQGHDMTIGEYLRREGYSEQFSNDFLLPISAAVWDTAPDKLFNEFPVRTLVQFMNNHNLLQVIGAPDWLTIGGGSKTYVDTILSALPPNALRISSPVHSVRTLESGKVLLTTVSGKSEEYDHVIMACHADASLAILKAGGGVTREEESILGGFQWNKNIAVIHSDTKLMPKNQNAWSSWNYIAQSYVDDVGVHRAHYDAVSCTYWLNYIQHLSVEKHGQIFLTLNPPFEPDPGLVFREFSYDHPVLDANAVALQRRIRTIQNTRGISYAGAWLGYGFHEDGFTSGLRAVTNAIPDVHPPFEIDNPDREPGEAFMGRVFDWLEDSGWRVYLGAVLAKWLGWIAWVLGVNVGGGVAGVGDLKRVTGKARA